MTAVLPATPGQLWGSLFALRPWLLWLPTLSCLQLAAIVQVAAVRLSPGQVAPRQATQGLAAQGLAAQGLAKQGPATQDAAVAPTAIEKLLGELDRRFAAGDVAGYLAMFDADHAGALAMLGHHLERLRDQSRQRTRQSHIVVGPRQFGERTLVRVRHEIVWRTGSPTPTPTTIAPHAEDSYLVVRRAADGSAVPTFAIEIDPDTHCVAGGTLRCPPCNYEIGGAAGWLCVPLRRDRTLALEAASFYLLGSNVACDVSVQVSAEPAGALAVAQRLAAALVALEPAAVLGIPERWLPPRHATAPPTGMDAARVEVQLPADDPDDGGGRSIFHVVTFGGLQHLLLLRGSALTLRRHREQIDELFATYMLLEANCDLATAAARSLLAHTGGELTATGYRNERFGVAIDGPEGWSAEQRPGGAAFRVRWTSPTGGRMWLIGHGVPPGMTAWSTDRADLWLANQCERRGLQIPAADPAAWQAADDGSDGRVRTLVARALVAEAPAAPARRTIRLSLRDDLLIVVEAYGTTKGDEAALAAALATLRRE